MYNYVLMKIPSKRYKGFKICLLTEKKSFYSMVYVLVYMEHIRMFFIKIKNKKSQKRKSTQKLQGTVHVYMERKCRKLKFYVICIINQLNYNKHYTHSSCVWHTYTHTHTHILNISIANCLLLTKCST